MTNIQFRSAKNISFYAFYFPELSLVWFNIPTKMRPWNLLGKGTYKWSSHLLDALVCVNYVPVLLPFLLHNTCNCCASPVSGLGSSKYSLHRMYDGRLSEVGKCGGIGWSGSTTCVSGSVCTVLNECPLLRVHFSIS